MLRWAVYAAIGLVIAVGVAALVGLALPVAHQARRTAVVPGPQGEVFAAITDFARHPEWRTGVSRVTVEGGGVGARVREENRTGSLSYRVERLEAPSRLVMRIVDESAFGGTWTYELRPVAAGTEVTITEDGEIYNPIFRVVARFVLGYHAAIDEYLADLRRRTPR
jgi:uncharacterized protein YndB with AHSA1/START domain